MEKRILGFGALFGALGGLLAFVFARIFAEPVIQRAIDYEGGRDEAQHMLDEAAGIAVDSHEHELFTRAVQQNIGIATGMIAFGLAMGLLFAVVYYLLLGRVGRMSPRNLALTLGAVMFGVLYLVPFLKYPANPPAVGHDETIGWRTGLYLTMVLFSVIFAIGAFYLGKTLSARMGNWSAALIAIASYAVAIAIVMLLLPSLGELAVNVREYGKFTTETPQPLLAPDGTIVFPGFSADDLYSFRLYSIVAQMVLWGTLALCFAPWAARNIAAAPSPARDRVTN